MNSLEMSFNQTKAKLITEKLKQEMHNNLSNCNYNIDPSRDEACAIRLKFPTKIPVIVEKYAKEKYLPDIRINRYLVPEETTISQFQNIIRTKIKINSTKSFFMFINNRTMSSLSRTVGDIYREYRSNDGFLHFHYASQDGFGGFIM